MCDELERKRPADDRSHQTVKIETTGPISRFDQLKAALAEAPDDDEPLTDADRAAIAAGWEDYRQGRTITLEELLQRETSETETASSRAD